MRSKKKLKLKKKANVFLRKTEKEFKKNNRKATLSIDETKLLLDGKKLKKYFRKWIKDPNQGTSPYLVINKQS